MKKFIRRFVGILIFISLAVMLYRIYPDLTVVVVGTIIGYGMAEKFADWIRPAVWIALLKATNSYAGDDKKSS